MERKTKKQLAVGMYRKGLRVEAIAEILETDPSYVANALIEQGLSPNYMDLYTVTGPQNRYARMLSGILKFRDLEAAKACVDQLDAAYKGFAAMRDRRGMHQCQVLALTGKNRAEGVGKWQEAQLFAEWLGRNLQVFRPAAEASIEESAETEPAPPLRLAA